jgi:predicted nucleic acid-binding protein
VGVSRVATALLDTSVVIDMPEGLDDIAVSAAISTVTIAELAAGLSADDPVLAAVREAHYALVLERFAPIALGVSAARMYGALHTALRQGGRNPRSRRFDLLIAATAVDAGMPVVTRNARDFDDIHPALQVIEVPPS